MKKKDLKYREDPVAASDYAATLYIDESIPLILEMQLFWFMPELAEYLKKHVFFEASNHVKIFGCKAFTYMPFKMDALAEQHGSGYLLGFESNQQAECYSKISVHFDTEEEKVHNKVSVIQAINELIRVATPDRQSCGPIFTWWLDKQ